MDQGLFAYLFSQRPKKILVNRRGGGQARRSRLGRLLIERRERPEDYRLLSRGDALLPEAPGDEIQREIVVADVKFVLDSGALAAILLARVLRDAGRENEIVDWKRDANAFLDGARIAL